MRMANQSEIPRESWRSSSGKFNSWGKSLNQAIGGDSRSMDLTKRWPFDVELAGIPPGAANCPFHSHSAQWEFYLVISGVLTVRHEGGTTEAKPGDYFMFAPGEPHQLMNQTSEEVTYYCIADNPVGEHCHYPDSQKWSVAFPARGIVKGEKAEYFSGEDEQGGGWQQ